LHLVIKVLIASENVVGASRYIYGTYLKLFGNKDSCLLLCQVGWIYVSLKTNSESFQLEAEKTVIESGRHGNLRSTYMKFQLS
jgi:hypothetical protein